MNIFLQALWKQPLDTSETELFPSCIPFSARGLIFCLVLGGGTSCILSDFQRFLSDFQIFGRLLDIWSSEHGAHSEQLCCNGWSHPQVFWVDFFSFWLVAIILVSSTFLAGRDHKITELPILVRIKLEANLREFYWDFSPLQEFGVGVIISWPLVDSRLWVGGRCVFLNNGRFGGWGVLRWQDTLLKVWQFWSKNSGLSPWNAEVWWFQRYFFFPFLSRHLEASQFEKASIIFVIKLSFIKAQLVCG